MKERPSAQDTHLVKRQQYADRWSSFGEGTGIEWISDRLSASDLSALELFADYDERFLEKIAPDVSIARWRPGSVLFEEGTYLDLAFSVLSGEVEVFVSGVGSGSEPIFATTLAARDPGAGGSGEPSQLDRRARALDAGQLTFLSAMDFDLPRNEGMRLGAGEIFGEIGALNGWPQSVTARTRGPCELVQIRVPALRLMKKRSKELKRRLDDRYRSRTLSTHLAAAPLLRDCDPGLIDALTDRVELVSCEPDEVVVREGDTSDAFYLVRSGFLKLSHGADVGAYQVGYLSKGMTAGEVELLLEEPTWRWTLTSVGFTELVRIERADIVDLFRRHPFVEAGLWKQAVARIKSAGYHRRDPRRSEFLQFSLDTGLVEGNSILAIDLTACTRCDDCVRACADLHDGRTRFVREGERYGNLLIAKSCYHCQDPVCLIGCPTGAIRRAQVGDVVDIDDDLCIGCGACSRSCPYDAIVMHETGLSWPATMLPAGLRGKPQQIASKCDLCYTSNWEPACVRACPQGCAFRVESLEEFQKLVTGDE